MVLENTTVNYYFEKICSIPHISFHEKKLSDYICSIAEKNHLEYIRDEYNNCIVFIPATKGYEDNEPILFQGHMDMVGNKTKDSDFDFLCDPLKLNYDGTILKADNTTLGGDDGVAVAIMLGLMSDKDYGHPLIECVFTVEEETGCDGASKLDISRTVSRRMVNLDGQGEGNVTVGNYCSDRIIISGKLPVTRTEKRAYKIHIGPFEPFTFGNKVLDPTVHPIRYFFHVLKNYDYELVSFHSGRAENMPPVEIDTVLIMEENSLKEFVSVLRKQNKVEYSLIESDYVIDDEVNEKIVNLAENCQNGPLSFNEEGEMITSFMFGQYSFSDSGLKLLGSTRCLNEELNSVLKNELLNLAGKNGCELKSEVRYVSWPYRKDSPLKEEFKAQVKKCWNKDIVEMICPGGLEITDFLAKRDFDVLSIGCDAGEFHNPGEWLNIKSLNRLYDLLKKMLSEEKI